MWSRLLLAALAFSSVHAQSVCYGSSGNEDPGLGVCDPSLETSSCCNLGDYCLSNGLCQVPGVNSVNSSHYTIYYIAGCTNETATDGDCYAYARCIKEGVGVTVCGDGNYCCYGLDSCDCKNSTQTFNLGSGAKIITSLPATQNVSPSTTASSSSTTSSSTASRTTSTASSASSTAPASSSSSASSGGTNDSVAVGAGVGVGVGVPLLAAIAAAGFWFWRKRKNSAPAAGAASAAPYEHDQGTQPYAGEPKYAGGPGYAPGYAPVPAHDGYYNQAQPSEMYGSHVPQQDKGGVRTELA